MNKKVINNIVKSTLIIGIGVGAIYASGISIGPDTTLGELASGMTPSGAVIAFDLESCPNGWTEYTQAYGRVVRGIDKSGTNIDPDGQRVLGGLQEDEFKLHSHNMNTAAGGIDNNGNGVQRGFWRNTPGKEVTGVQTGGDETRMKNVALLYCKKN